MSRFVARAAMLLAIAVAVATCSESPTSAVRAPVRLAFAPHFSTAAAAIYRSLSGFDVTLDNVHVVVRDATPGPADGPGRLLEDTTIAFPATQNEITIDIDLTITGEQETVVAAIELRQGSISYFAGNQVLVATRGQTATAPEPLELGYVGPGAGAASLNVTPDAATLAPSSSFQFSARVLDQTEHVVTNLPLAWSTSDAAIATVTPSGLVTSTAKAGTVTLTVAGLNGISQQTTLRVQPVASLVVHGGAGQSAIAGSTLTTRFEVQALDATQQPVIGAPITFTAVNGAGSVSTTSATTDASGLASTTVTLGSAAGTYTFTAQAGAGSTATTRIVATATAGAAASLGIVSGNQQADTVLSTLGKPLTVRVADSFGNPVPNQVVDFRVTSGQAGLLAAAGAAPAADLQAATGTDGTASVSLIGGAVAGTVRVTASLTTTTIAPASFEETLRPGVASRLVMLQQPSPTAQATITLGRQPKVQVADLYGNPVALAGLTIDASYTLDCGSGPVCARVVAPRAGVVLLDRTTAPATRALSPKRPSLTRNIPGRSRLTVPVAIAATRSISDTFPQGLGGTTRAVTDGNGVASFSDLSLDLSVVQGGWLLTFFDANETLESAVSDDIVLSPGPITSIVAQLGQDTLFYSTLSDTLHPAVVVIDPVGNGIPGVTVTWAVQDGYSELGSLTTQTDANGVASPGNWLLSSPTGGLLNFEIVATPNASKVENAPLHLLALPLLQ